MMRWAEALGPAPAERSCNRCFHFMNDRAAVERELPGLLVLSSAYGDSWGDAGLCTRHHVMLLPFNTCDGFAPRTPTSETPTPPAG